VVVEAVLIGPVSGGIFPACAAAPSVGWLIGARVIQGTAAALLTPASLALIGATYPRDERAAAIGVWAAASALTSAAGPVIGGWLTGRFGWPAVFWINPPLAIVAVALLWLSAPADRIEPRRFDFVGATLIALSLAALTWSLSQIGHSEPRAAGAFGLDTVALAAGVLGLAGLGVYGAWERMSAHPMTPPRLAQNRAFVGLNAATLLIYAGLAIVFLLLPFELEDRRGLSPASVGMAFLRSRSGLDCCLGFSAASPTVLEPAACSSRGRSARPLPISGWRLGRARR
jgi:MFS family permease